MAKPQKETDKSKGDALLKRMLKTPPKPLKKKPEEKKPDDK